MAQRPFSSTRPRSVVTARARKAVNQWLEIMVGAGRAGEDAESVLSELGRLGEDAIPALVDALDGRDARRSTCAAWYLLAVHAKRPSLLPNSGLVERCARMFVAAVKSADPALRYLGCVLLMDGSVPTVVVPHLRAMLKSRDAETRTLAAAALCRMKPSRLLVRHLRSGVQSSIAPLAVLSAIGLSKVPSHEGEGVDAMVELFAQADHAFKITLAIAFRPLGTRAARAIPSLSPVMFRPDAPPFLKYAIAKSVAIVSCPTKQSRESLVQAIGSGDPPVIRGTMEGLHETGNVFPDLVVDVARWLSAPDVELRRAAAESLALIGMEALPALEPLLARIGSEFDEDASFAVILALTNLPAEAFPKLVEIILEHNALRMPHAAMAMSRMGDVGVRLIAELLPGVQDVRLAQVLLHVIREMGVRAAPIVPVLDALLRQVDDDEIALMIILAIHSTGPGSASAIPALIERVTKGPEENRSVARLALWNAGPGAIPLIERARAVADGQAREHLSRVLAGMRTPDTGEFARYEPISESHLRIFDTMCELLNRSRGMSYPKISAELRRDLLSRGSPKSRDGLSPSQLRKIVGVIADAHGGIKLIDTKEGSQTCRLTPEGIGVAREVRACLQLRRARRGEAVPER